MSAEDVMMQELELYSTHAERAAYRAALSTAAGICDGFKMHVEKANSYRGGKVTQVGQAMADVADKCAAKIWAARERVTFPESETV